MTPAEQRQAIWQAARDFKARITATVPEGDARTEAHIRADWAAVWACGSIRSAAA